MKKFIASFLRSYLEIPQKSPKIVCLGGGTGLSTLLRGLKLYSHQITAIVTMCDEGGSTGRLRRALGVPAVGDLRHCLAALSDDEATMTKLLNYRFAGQRYGNDNDLGGHNFGNLLLVALSEIMGNFDKGLEEATRILNISGRVLPSTAADVHLWAQTTEGEKVFGEDKIDLGQYNGKRAIKTLHLKPARAKGFPDALKAIYEADIITAGPGDLFTSVMPNLLIGDIAQALKKSPAKKIFIVNVTNKPFETPHFTVTDYLEAIKRHLGENPFKIILLNSNQTPKIPPKLKYTYVTEGKIKEKNLAIIRADLIDINYPLHHDPHKLAKAVMSVLS